MRKSLTAWITLALLVSLTAGAQNQQPANRPGTVVPLPRDLEIQLALSSLPPHLRENATVYVLNPDKGFEVARAGTNGFSALVARTECFDICSDAWGSYIKESLRSLIATGKGKPNPKEK